MLGERNTVRTAAILPVEVALSGAQGLSCSTLRVAGWRTAPAVASLHSSKQGAAPGLPGAGGAVHVYLGRQCVRPRRSRRLSWMLWLCRGSMLLSIPTWAVVESLRRRVLLPGLRDAAVHCKPAPALMDLPPAADVL